MTHETILNNADAMQRCIRYYREHFPQMVDDDLTELYIRMECQNTKTRELICEIQEDLDQSAVDYYKDMLHLATYWIGRSEHIFKHRDKQGVCYYCERLQDKDNMARTEVSHHGKLHAVSVCGSCRSNHEIAQYMD